MIEVLARVEDEREAYARFTPNSVGFNMGSWFREETVWMPNARGAFCGTTACLAGHAVLMEGYEVGGSETCRDPKTGERFSVETMGAEILGLSEEAAMNVFYLEDLDSVYHWVAEYFGVDEAVLRDKVQAQRDLPAHP